LEAQRVAAYAHRRDCTSFDGRRVQPAPRFEGEHLASDVFWAQHSISTVLTALRVPLDAFIALIDTAPNG